MEYSELIIKVAQRAGITKAQAKMTVAEFVKVVTESLAVGESVSVYGFGVFKVVERAERKGRNPRTGEELILPAGKAVKFVAGKRLKEAAGV